MGFVPFYFIQKLTEANLVSGDFITHGRKNQDFF